MPADVDTILLVAIVTGLDSVTTTLVGGPIEESPGGGGFGEDGFGDSAGDEDVLAIDEGGGGVTTDVEEITVEPEGHEEQATVFTIVVVIDGFEAGGLAGGGGPEGFDAGGGELAGGFDDGGDGFPGGFDTGGDAAGGLTGGGELPGGVDDGGEGRGELDTVDTYVPPEEHGTFMVL